MKNKICCLFLIVFGCCVIIIGFIRIPENKDNTAKISNREKIVAMQSDVQRSMEKTIDEKVSEYLESMDLEEKVAQLFIVLPEALMQDVGCVTKAGEVTRDAINQIPVGGFIYMAPNLQSEEQVKEMLMNVQNYSIDRINLPMFLCVDEEGGSVARIGGSGKFDVPIISDMSTIGKNGDVGEAYNVGAQIGTYLSELGFNVDFAPVADVLSNPENIVVRERSFGSDSILVAEMALAVANGLKSQGVNGTFKHFPGHGATSGDTHKGYAYSEKTLVELEKCELVPFQIGIENNIPFIMVGHISLPNVLDDNTPATLSEYIVTGVLRDQMGYTGLIITDAMNMGAIVQNYTSDEAAVKAIQAGIDIILMPENFYEAYYGIIEAVNEGTISLERIDESVRRILYLKFEMNL